ncbi:hypothetical protein ACIPW5_09905 [Streptomyces sp. NPDC090077]|uniref:hypothetical protein n=1 Tax=Streptomyces sp. NPDC090077 TaxID=3365938 RepID=UPI0037F8F111
MNQLAGAIGVGVLGALFTALLGADPQVAGGRPPAAFLSALAGCCWLLIALAAATGLLVRRLPPYPRPVS